MKVACPSGAGPLGRVPVIVEALAPSFVGYEKRRRTLDEEGRQEGQLESLNHRSISDTGLSEGSTFTISSWRSRMGAVCAWVRTLSQPSPPTSWPLTPHVLMRSRPLLEAGPNHRVVVQSWLHYRHPSRSRMQTPAVQGASHLVSLAPEPEEDVSAGVCVCVVRLRLRRQRQRRRATQRRNPR